MEKCHAAGVRGVEMLAMAKVNLSSAHDKLARAELLASIGRGLAQHYEFDSSVPESFANLVAKLVQRSDGRKPEKDKTAD
jgi:hypothetical protein